MQPLVFLLLVAVVNVGVCQGSCFHGWVLSDNYCYGFGGTAVAWGDAQAICQAYGASLAEIPASSVQNFLLKIARKEKDNCYWLGGSDIFREADWRWSSRRDFFSRYKNFFRHEPTNYPNEHCLCMVKTFNYKWGDQDCNVNCNFICAKQDQ
ncbi:hypothetical protein BsWGS_11917 [Bradybaena similaris]